MITIDEIVRMAQEEGEIFEITREGKVIARLEPVHSLPQSAKQDHEAFWRRMDKYAAQLGSQLPEKVDAVELVRDVRREL
jgi:antitoxin (DNA-binding transcriptional repressor) of toxin-antitoxin stability system